MKNIKIFIPICATAFCACSNVNDKICEDNSGDEGGVIAKSINTLLSLKESSAYNEVLDEQIDNFKCFKKEIDWHKWRFLFKQKKFLEGFDAIDENIEGCSNGAKRFLFIHSFLNIFHDDALLYFAETSGSLLEKIIFRSKKQLLKFKFLFDLDFGDPVTNQDRREVIQFLCDLIDSYPDQKDIQKKKRKTFKCTYKGF